MVVDLKVEKVSKVFGTFKAVDEVSFEVVSGNFFSILGPSGCGKTTLLRMIAGFLEPTEGQIYIRQKLVNGIPPNQRPVNLVFQNLALFPMMNVFENIAFGLKRRKVEKKVIEAKVKDILARVGLSGFEKKKINELSGGQKQRVAIARALVLEPSVLLLDEPLGALDLKLREQMKVELKKLQAEVGTTFVYITHDQSEALVMSDFVAVMNKGRFEQIDTPQNLYRSPKTAFVAKFVGDNNALEGEMLKKEGEMVLVSAYGHEFWVRAGSYRLGKKISVFIRPESFLLEPEENLSKVNRLKVKIKDILFDGANSKLLCLLPAGPEIMVALPQNKKFAHLKPGDDLNIGWFYEDSLAFS
ncbi:MAG: spermidine/putrescine transport system ATP-binding protein [Desulfonauticus sp.]|jgi:spermidine/putrescine transport system ATP-binding protein|nr:MAG: Spermidine/putrescine ABC transporter, ATP-binding protein [Desulfonauticus sp. 38_4375]MDK2921787.1 spermidine/putrescine transport system ATP-binding protein [Desulfonauticus sp.]